MTSSTFRDNHAHAIAIAKNNNNSNNNSAATASHSSAIQAAISFILAIVSVFIGFPWASA